MKKLTRDELCHKKNATTENANTFIVLECREQLKGAAYVIRLWKMELEGDRTGDTKFNAGIRCTLVENERASL